MKIGNKCKIGYNISNMKTLQKHSVRISFYYLLLVTSFL